MTHIPGLALEQDNMASEMKTSGSEHLLLKWGTLKGWRVQSEASLSALQRYTDAGTVSLSAMAQHDSPEQKAALCDLIDAIDGEIQNDWSGEVMSKDEAKKYVMEYGQPALRSARGEKD